MDAVYTKIWEAAKPYYERGRPMDVAHIEWFMRVASEICEKEGLDASLLLPLAILHDVGYSEIQNVQKADYYAQNIRLEHMRIGKAIAEKILRSIGYPEDKIATIVEYVGVHDIWAFGEVNRYIQDPILGTFKDLDYLWIYTKDGCDAIQQTLGKNDQEMLEHLKNEPSPIGGKKPFSNESTRALHDTLLRERELEFGTRVKERLNN